MYLYPTVSSHKIILYIYVMAILFLQNLSSEMNEMASSKRNHEIDVYRTYFLYFPLAKRDQEEIANIWLLMKYIHISVIQ